MSDHFTGKLNNIFELKCPSLHQPLIQCHHHVLPRTGAFPGSVTMAGAGPVSGAAGAGAAGFTTIYPVTECMEVGEGE